MILTEGKTDVVHIQLAIKKLSREYPELISYNNTEKSYKYKIKFLTEKAKRKYFYFWWSFWVKGVHRTI